ncbi:MAG: DUF6516 family protein [Anaerolineae bacterium]|nr:DUF6516 family protein [Anaerolineae bacterium]MDW8099067.1 DUF6516 family protein [Anaerolineae bacterium]
MSDIESYLTTIELALVSSPIIAEYSVIRSWANTDDGYIRIRAMLTNGDFLEAAEYFTTQAGEIITVDYRHQWMDGNRELLKRRWDSTPHHPELENFPHHIHVGSEESVAPGNPVSFLELLRILESELASSE